MSYLELCEQVTASIVDAIDAGGVGSWSAPWHHRPIVWAPINATTSARYTGVNIVSLALAGLTANHPTGWWATYRQWSNVGGQVRRGERSTTIVKWVPVTRTTSDPSDTATSGNTEGSDSGSRLVPKVYRVFNAAQVDGWQPPATNHAAVSDRVAAAQAWIEGTGAGIFYGYGHACYRQPPDRIEVPDLAQYDDPVDHIITVAHELVHWTRHPSRLDRSFPDLGVDAYAAEELVAELGAAFCAARLGLTNRPRPDHAQYLAHWLHLLQADPKTLFQSAALAQRAVDHLNPPTPDHDTTIDAPGDSGEVDEEAGS